MKLKVAVILIILALFIPAIARAQSTEKLGFEFWQAQYQMGDLVDNRFDARELSGELDVQSDVTMKLSYQFWDQAKGSNNKLENFTLDTVKDFASAEDEQLAVGLGLDYYQQTTKTEKLDLSQLKKKSLDLVLDIEKNIMERVGIFAEVKYGLYNDYNFSNQHLDSELSYDSNYNYSIKAGLDFKVGSNLRANLGYKLSQESLERSDGQSTTINSYDLSKFSQLQQGLFLGLETRF